MRRKFFTVLLTAFLFSVPVKAAENTAPQTMTISTASPGGVYYPYGHGLAILLTKYVGVTFTDQATQGGVQNVLLLEHREAMMALTTMGIALQAWDGTGWAKGTQYRSMRALFPMYDAPFHFAAPKRLNLGSLSAFAGKKIGDGPKAGPSNTYISEIFKVLDIPAVLRNGAWEDIMSQVASGDLDGVAFSLGIPASDAAALDGKDPLDFFQPSPEQVALVRTRLPELTPSLIPAGTYPSLHENYRTFGLYNFAVIHRDVSDDLAYRLSRRSLSISRSWSAPIPLQRRPSRPISTGTRSCRSIPEPHVIIVRSGSPSRPLSNQTLDTPVARWSRRVIYAPRISAPVFLTAILCSPSTWASAVGEIHLHRQLGQVAPTAFRARKPLPTS